MAPYLCQQSQTVAVWVGLDQRGRSTVEGAPGQQLSMKPPVPQCRRCNKVLASFEQWFEEPCITWGWSHDVGNTWMHLSRKEDRHDDEQ